MVQVDYIQLVLSWIANRDRGDIKQLSLRKHGSTPSSTETPRLPSKPTERALVLKVEALAMPWMTVNCPSSVAASNGPTCSAAYQMSPPSMQALGDPMAPVGRLATNPVALLLERPSPNVSRSHMLCAPLSTTKLTR